jgi:hypothetical protein
VLAGKLPEPTFNFDHRELRYMNLSQLSKDQFTCRCPECFKLFSVRIADVQETMARFQCNACQTVFAVNVLEALDREDFVGTRWSPPAAEPKSTPVAKPELKENATPSPYVRQEMFSCPKCTTPYASGDTECTKCGVVFLKLEEAAQRRALQISETPVTAAREVKEFWEVALQDYDNFAAHQNFITAAWADGSLEYAAHVYGRIQQVNPHDEIALKAQRQIEALTAARFQVVNQAEETQYRAWLDGLQFFKTAVLSLRKIKFMTVIMVLCGAVIMTGLLLPHLRNLVGLGTSILFFVLALRYYFRAI